MTFRRLASPLHAARASAAGAWCLVLAAAALSTRDPVLLGALLGAVILGGVQAGVGATIRARLPLALGFAVAIALVNVLVVRSGLTVLLRFGELPPFGQVDVTLEALVHGALDGLRVIVVILATAVFSAVVDPDELLRRFGRVSPRAALTAVVAMRLVPVLARDARRVQDAARCRPDGGGSGPAARAAVLRAVTAGALDRAVDVAATLEVRGYGAGGLRPARARVPWSRHDLGFAAAALAIAAIAAAARAAGVGAVQDDTLVRVAVGPAELGVAVALLAVALLPFADRRGIAP